MASLVGTFISQTANLDLTRSRAGRPRLAELCTDLLHIAIRMREAEELGGPPALRKLILHYLRLFEENCRSAGISADATTDARYALVALLDETVLSIPSACRDYWLASPLQLELYGESIAGEEFFRRLRLRMDAPARSMDVLEVYYLCLALGLEGKYKLGRSEERLALMQALGRMLTSGRPVGELSPHGRCFEMDAAGRGRLRQLVPMTALACALGVVTVWMCLTITSVTHVRALVRALEPLVSP